MTELGSFIRDGMLAADHVNRTGGTGPIPLDQIPENPILFGDDPFGDRFSFDVDVGFADPDGDIVRWLGIQIRSPVEMTYSEIVAEARQEAERRANDSPRILQGRDLAELTIVEPEIIFLERRF